MKHLELLDINVKKLLADRKSAQEKIDHFIALIPEGARVIGVLEFIDLLNLTRPQYYRRLKDYSLWTEDELELVAMIFKKNKLVK